MRYFVLIGVVRSDPDDEYIEEHIIMSDAESQSQQPILFLVDEEPEEILVAEVSAAEIYSAYQPEKEAATAVARGPFA